MGVKTALRTQLLTDVSAEVSTRVYQDVAPREALKRLHSHAEPFITFQQIANYGVDNLTAASGLTEVDFQIDVWAATTATREAIAELVRTALDGFRGTVSTVDIRSLRVTNKGRDAVEQPQSAQEKAIYRTTIEASVWHSETAPTF